MSSAQALPGSLRRKILLPLLLLGIVVAVVVLWWIHFTSQQQLTAKLYQRAELVANMVNYAAESISRPGELQRIVAAIGAEQDVLDIVVAGGDPARVIASTKNIWFGKLLSELPGEEVADDLAKAMQIRASHSHFNVEQQLFDFSSPLRLSQLEPTSGAHLEGAVMVHLDTRPMQAEIRSSTILISNVFLAVLLALAAFGYGLLNKFVLRPIARIGTQIEKRAPGLTQDWEPAGAHDEIGALASTLRDALTRTDTAMHALEQQKTALFDSEERYRLIAEYSSDIISRFSVDGIFSYVSPASASVLGYEPEQMLGKSLFDWVYPDDVPLVKKMLAAVRTSYVLDTLTCRLRSVEGEFVWMETSVRVLRDKTGAAAAQIVGVSRDITERKRLERMKNEFVSTVSHEIRTPMNAILGFTQLLSYDHNLTVSQHANLTKVRKAGEHLLNLINDVLDLSRIESGKVTLSMEPVAVSLVLLECRNLAQPLADARNIKLRVDSDSAGDLFLHVDRTRLRQVLINLISNAVKYNRAGGTVWVVCTPAESGRVRISVRDNGPGIAPEKQAEMFQPFNRLGAERGEVEGTGIGLTITKQLVELMQGVIGMTSTLGEGSTFWAEFMQDHSTPVAIARDYEANDPQALATRTSQHLVLYVEDNPVNLEFIQALCAQFWPNMHLLSATTAEVGLELAAAQRPELILMDINLPGMDGYEALAHLKADANLRHIPVVAVTANAMKENIERGHSVGFADYLTKPIDISRFLTVVDALLSRGGAGPLPAAAEGEERILLAEDNLVNQDVARGMLEILGCAVDVVNDGRAALTALEQRQYAVVLMDCEMPVLDGYAATAAIRKLEGTLRHTPIIAVTAHAPNEDAAQRQAAGMDGYLAKPINMEQLRAVLSRWIKSSKPAESVVNDDAESQLDEHATEQLKALLGARAVPIVDSLLEDLPRRLELLRVAIASGDIAAVRSEAHTMKGSSSNLGAIHFSRLCARVSDICKSGELQRLPEMHAALETEFREHLTPALVRFRLELLHSSATSMK